MKALQRYVRPQVTESWNKRQVVEYYGNTQMFYCTAYEKLQRGLLISQQAFQMAKNLDNKQKAAETELLLWRNFISERLKELPEQYKINKLLEHHLERTWKRISGRQTLIPAANFLEFFVEYNKHYSGEFPFDQIALLGMLHPIRGHLTRLPGSFHWQQFLHFLQLETLATYERQNGQQLPAKQISAYNLWIALDEQQTGYLDFPRFLQMLHVLHISSVFTFADLTKELAWTMRDLPRELEGMSEGKAVFRFELIRRLFLERNE